MTDIGRARKANQDEALSLELPDGAVLLLVADGVGGAPGGEVASAATAQAVCEALLKGIAGDPEDALRKAIESANAHVLKMAAADVARPEMASTVVAAVVVDGQVWVASVGDSRGYLFNSGALTQVTTDDSWVAEQVRSGLMGEEEAENSLYKNVITRGVGVEDSIETGPIWHRALAAGDVILLCSDGLYRMLRDADLERVLGIGQDLESTARQLVAMSNEAGGADNISVAIYRHPSGGSQAR